MVYCVEKCLHCCISSLNTFVEAFPNEMVPAKSIMIRTVHKFHVISCIIPGQESLNAYQSNKDLS